MPWVHVSSVANLAQPFLKDITDKGYLFLSVQYEDTFVFSQEEHMLSTNTNFAFSCKKELTYFDL